MTDDWMTVQGGGGTGSINVQVSFKPASVSNFFLYEIP